MSKKEERQIGVIVVKDGKIVGFELFDHPDTFEVFKEDFYQKYALEIATKGEKVDVDPKTLLESLFAELEAGKVSFGEKEQNIGGENIYIETPQLRGAFFQRGNQPIYISVVRK